MAAIQDRAARAGLPFVSIVRDPEGPDPKSVAWARVMHHGTLKSFLLDDAQFAPIETFVIHSLNGKLAPFSFFEIAPYLPELFCSEGAISGIRLDSSIYTSRQGGVVKSSVSSRKMQEEGSSVLHAGGMTVFKRGGSEYGKTTLLELSHDMLNEDYLDE